MDIREQKGLAIASHCKISRLPNGWGVPSQSGPSYYVVNLGDEPHCTCLDHETRGVRCKHIFAVEFYTCKRRNPDGTVTLKSTIEITDTCRKTYKQNWPAYNAAQTNEKEKFLSLLQDLCKGVQQPPRAKTGRKPMNLADGIFSACYKVYSGFSARRFMTDMRDAAEDGYVGAALHFNTVLKCLENPALTPILKAMIVESSKPLAMVEQDFACDSTGFLTTRYDTWFDHKYGHEKKRQHWTKLHFTCGVRTNIITAVVIKEENAGDSPQLPEMVAGTAQNFTIRDFTADKAYASLENFEAIDKTGGMGFIAFKGNTTGAVGGMFEKMFHYFMFRREEFLTHYHKRSNAESTVSMIKRKFGNALRSKTDIAMVNETLAKVLVHNVVVLIHEMYELGIEPSFWTKTSAAHKPADLHTNAVSL